MKRGAGIGNLGRAPVPEWEEVARAAWPGRVAHRVSAAAGRAYLPVLLVSSAAGVLAAWLQAPWIGLVAWLVSAAADWLATPSDPAVLRLVDLVGLRAPLRGLLRSLPAVAVVFASGAALPVAVGYVTVVLFVQLAWVAQPVLATWLSRSAPPLLYVPGAAFQPRPFSAHARAYARAVGTPGAVVVVEFLALVAALASALRMVPQDATVVFLAVAAVLALAYLAWTGGQALGVRRAQPAWSEQLLADLAAASPSFLVYVSLAARQSKYIVNQWVPALDGLPQAGLLLVREASQLSPLAVSRHAVVYAPGQRDVERLLLPGVRVAFYLAYGDRNSQLLRYARLKHVLLAHGDSDKAASANNTARVFDEIWVAGEAAVDRFTASGVAIPRERFVMIGRPQVTGLSAGPTGNPVPVVLYAPTFEGYLDQADYSSLERMGPGLVRQLVNRTPVVDVWFRPHPASGTQRASVLTAIAEVTALLRSSGGDRLATADNGFALADCLAAADVLVTDVSAVASDFLATGRPVVVCNPMGLSPEAFVAAYPSHAGSYVLGPDPAGIPDMLSQAFGEDPLRDVRAAMKRHVLGDPPGGPQAAFVANVARITS